LKAPSFAYAKPRTLAEALELLARHGEGARILAGGQSLIPSLNMRLSSPEILIDITGLPGLNEIKNNGKSVRVGALVTHSQLEKSPEIQKHVPLLAQAVPHIAHAAIRNRGTLGGSLALADPAAEYPAVAVALQATIVITGSKGERPVKAEDFFKGLFETDLKQGEILTAVEFPTGGKSAFLELTRRHGDYAIIGLAVHESRFVFFNAGPTPVFAKQASACRNLKDALSALKKELSPPADLYNTSATKLHLAGVLLERAWNTLSTSR
jgi:aerobic carbon-monoxide dehydrogenase medium subunit